MLELLRFEGRTTSWDEPALGARRQSAPEAVFEAWAVDARQPVDPRG